jgi:hypothetical protein
MKLFGYSISLNVIILIGILYLIMVVNALSSSCNREGYEMLPPGKAKANELMKDINDAQAVNAPPITKPMIDGFMERLNALKPAAHYDRRLIKPISDISVEIKKLYRLIPQPSPAPYAPIPSPSPILHPSQLMQTKYNSEKQLAIEKLGVAKAAQAAAKAAAQAAAQAAQDAQYDALQ